MSGPDSPTLWESLRERFAVLRTSLAPIHCELRWLGQHCERVAFPLAQEQGQATVRLTLRRDDANAVTHQKLGDEPIDVRYTQRLSRLLAWLDVRDVEFDVRLEASQVYEAFAVVRSIALRSLHTGRRSDTRGPALALRSAEGLHVGCTRVRLDTDRQLLTIEYSYCQTAFSRVVGLLKRRNRAFRDHRAFFAAAPKYAAATLVVGVVPLLLFVGGAGTGVVMTAGAVAATLVAGAVYLFFLTIGSAEYDNEVQADRLRRAYLQIKSFNERIRVELQRAREYQRRLLPPADWKPQSPNVELAVRFEPQGEVGGDYYDFRELRDGRLVILFADVSGHGLAAALVTGVLKTIFEQSEDRLCRPAAFLEELNRRLLRIIPEDAFAAVVYALLEPDTGRLTYCNAGHNPPPLWVSFDGSAGGSQVRELAAGHGPIVGALEDWSCTVDTVQLGRGDRLLLITDGILDVVGAGGEHYGLDRVLEVVRKRANVSIHELCEAVVTAAATFGTGLPQPDDQTVVILEYRGP